MKKISLSSCLLLILPGIAISQNVGIGTTLPVAKLYIDGGVSVYSGLILTNTPAGPTLYFN